MLRRFRRSDATGLSTLVDRHFPEENRLLGMRPIEFKKIVERSFRLDLRILIALVRLVKGPIFDLFVVEVDGRIAATAFLVYLRSAGYIGMVMVDDPFRRRGYAAEVVRACIDHAGRSGRAYAMLDVLANNDPALRLYQKLGFHEIQRGRYYSLGLAHRVAPAPTPEEGEPIRPFERRDARELVRIAAAELPPEVAAVTPVEASDFTSAPFAARAFLSETEAWVVGPPGRPRGFVRATVAPAMEAANLTHPILDPTLPDELGSRLIEQALAWASAKGAPSIVTELKGSVPKAEAALRTAGFVPELELLTLVRSTTG
ncbi:MAG: GNAT family N-acetyltransferase [Thermoplasmata archaeon]|nr:GNAT family N-acetyltransferase [Thermoplasmata archaeon]